MMRPADCNRIHFACDGSIDLINTVPPEMIRTGDTASALDLDDVPCLWRCIGTVSGGFGWETIGPRTEDGLDKCIQECDLMCVVANEKEAS